MRKDREQQKKEVYKQLDLFIDTHPSEQTDSGTEKSARQWSATNHGFKVYREPPKIWRKLNIYFLRITAIVMIMTKKKMSVINPVQKLRRLFLDV